MKIKKTLFGKYKINGKKTNYTWIEKLYADFYLATRKNESWSQCLLDSNGNLLESNIKYDFPKTTDLELYSCFENHIVIYQGTEDIPFDKISAIIKLNKNSTVEKINIPEICNYHFVENHIFYFQKDKYSGVLFKFDIKNWEKIN
jgi:hypothetical protein